MSGAFVPTLHPRTHREYRYVYVVRSRRAGGLSVGINLDPQKTCNFDCVYCEVIDRREVARKAVRPPIDPADVVAELEAELVTLAAEGHAADVKDIAYAGDGEPSTFPGFFPLSEKVLDTRDRLGYGDIPLVLITNGSGLGREEMRQAHDLFAARGGVFWIKLDAGSEAFYRTVSRSDVPFERILTNLTDAARRHPVVIQSMFFRFHGTPPGAPEIEAYAGRVAGVIGAGGCVSLVQVYTVARETMEPGVAPLTGPELEEIAERVRRAAPGVPVGTYA